MISLQSNKQWAGFFVSVLRFTPIVAWRNCGDRRAPYSPQAGA